MYDQKGMLLDLFKGSSITTQTNQTNMYMYMQTTIIISPLGMPGTPGSLMYKSVESAFGLECTMT